MMFIDKVRQYNTVKKGVLTPIAKEFKPGLHVRLAAPVVGAYDRFSGRDPAVEAIQPEAVAGVPMPGKDEVTRDENLSTLQDQSENLSRSASIFYDNAKGLAEQFKEESNSFTGMFKGWFSKNKKQSDTESEYDEKSVSDESSLDYKTAREPWYRKGALGSAANWFQSGRRKGYHPIPDYDGESIISESETRELVQENDQFTGSTLGFFEVSLSSESPETALKSHLDSVKESGHTPGLTPEPSEEEKIGLVQRIKNMLVNFFMGPFRASKVVDEGSLSTSLSGSFTSLASQARAETPPPSYEEAIGAMEGRKSPFHRLWNSANGLIEKYIITPIRSLLSERDNVNSTEERESSITATFNTRHNVLLNGDLYTRDNNNPLVAGRGSIQEQPKSWAERHPRDSKVSWEEKAHTVRHSNGKFDTHL